MNRPLKQLLLALCSTLLMSCSGEGGKGVIGHSVVDSAGVQIVQSVSPAWGPNGRWIDPVPSLRIGQEAEGPYQFGALWTGLLLEDGRVVVAEGLAQELRVFDSAGRHLKTLGGRGSGPGEFRSLVNVFDYGDDSIAAFDQRLYRTTVFSLSSGDSRALENPIPGNYQLFGVLEDGPFLLFNPGQYNPDLHQGLQWDSTDIVAMHRFDGSSEVIARLPVLERMIGPGAARELLVPAHMSIQAAGKDGFYWAMSDRYEIKLYGDGGNVRRILRREVEPRRVTPTMIEEYEANFLDRVRRTQGEEAVASQRTILQEASIGASVPLFGVAFVDGDQRLWVAETTFPTSQEVPRRWSVFSREGIWMGDLKAPDGLWIVDSRGDTVLGIWRNEMDVPFVQLHSLSGG